MNFLNLKYFCAVVEEMNITKAAEKLHISQQTLSGQIAKIEQEYGTLLFERSPRLRLTYAGSRFLEFAQSVTNREKSLIAEFDDINEHRRGSLALGVTPTRSRVFLPQILPQFTEQYPQIQLDLCIDSYKLIEKKLIEGSLDLIVSILHEDVSPDMELIDLMQDQFCIAVPSIFFKRYDRQQPKTIGADTLEHLIHSGFIQKIPYITISSQSQVHRLMKLFFQTYQITPHILFEARDQELLLNLTLSGIGATFVVKSLGLKYLKLNTLVPDKPPFYLIPIDLPNSSQRVIIGCRKGRYKSWSTNNFITLARSIFSSRYNELAYYKTKTFFYNDK